MEVAWEVVIEVVVRGAWEVAVVVQVGRCWVYSSGLQSCKW